MHKRLPLREGSELRSVHRNDAQKLYDVIAENREFLAQWFDWASVTKSVEDTEGYIEQSIKKTKVNKAFDAIIWSEGELCGMIGFHTIDWHHRVVEMGYWISEKSQGKGLATRALQAMMLYAFRTWQVNRIEIICAVSNFKSRAVAERVGFTFEGIHREGQILAGSYVDEAVYSFLRRDYLARPSLLELPCQSRKPPSGERSHAESSRPICTE